MPEEIEVETKELQDTIHELHEEREEREAEERRTGWTKFIGLTTAILAVFAAIGALQSGALVNEALINQLKASDTWNEYQADRQKVHIYGLQAKAMLDSGISPARQGAAEKGSELQLVRKTQPERLSEYLAQVEHENSKTEKLSDTAKELGKEAHEEIEHHHRFAFSVAVIQVAIALGAVAALTRIRSVWYVSIAAGLLGVALFGWGFLK